MVMSSSGNALKKFCAMNEGKGIWQETVWLDDIGKVKGIFVKSDHFFPLAPTYEGGTDFETLHSCLPLLFVEPDVAKNEEKSYCSLL